MTDQKITGNQTADQARDIRGLLHLAGTYATRAVAAAEAMDTAFDAMIRKAADSDEAVRDLLTLHPTDWAARVRAHAAASQACSELAQARIAALESPWIVDGTPEQARAVE